MTLMLFTACLAVAVTAVVLMVVYSEGQRAATYEAERTFEPDVVVRVGLPVRSPSRLKLR